MTAPRPIPPLIIAASLVRRIEEEALRAYPNECCGVLLGQDEHERRRVERIFAARNESQEAQRHRRFVIAPRTLLEVEKAASSEGRTVLGFYHSHPDAPAQPSEYDLERAWPFYSYVILSVEKGQVVERTSWMLSAETRTLLQQDLEEA